jgi:hypothetical protein
MNMLHSIIISYFPIGSRILKAFFESMDKVSLECNNVEGYRHCSQLSFVTEHGLCSSYI